MTAIPKITAKDVDRFWAKTQPRPDGCIVWTGHLNRGRGTFTFSCGSRTDKKHILAHRVSATLKFGNIPDGQVVCHTCDNPSCVNPDHLFLGTQKDNVQDCINKGRFNCSGLQIGWGKTHKSFGDKNGTRLHPEKIAKGESHPFSIVTEAQVREIRRLKAEGVAVKEIAEEFSKRIGVGIDTIRQIAYRSSWKHIP